MKGRLSRLLPEDLVGKMWERNSLSGVSMFASNPLQAQMCQEWDEQWDGMVHNHNEDLLTQCQSCPPRITLLVAALAFGRALPIYERLMESKEVAAAHRDAFDQGRRKLNNWIYEDIKIDQSLCQEVKFGFVLSFGSPLTGLFHAFSEQLIELLGQIAEASSGGGSFPIVFNFDIIRSMIGDKLKHGARVEDTLALAERLGSREAERQFQDVEQFKKGDSEATDIFEKLFVQDHDLLGGETFQSLTK
ncbi:MAG: hypothetical protein ACI8UO_001271 [Verrucomicrobiales bacterium]|jgi:hypothetical protein